jgi:GNAT superfamily N-acetyltransferase
VNDVPVRPELCRFADAAESAAFADMYAAAPEPFAAAVGLRVERIAGATLLFAPGLPTPMFNRAIGFGTFEPASEATLDSVIERFRAAGSASHWISVSPAARPAEVAGWLAARGYAPPKRRAWAQMRWGESPPPAAGTTLGITPARREDAAPLTGVIAQAFDMPPPIAAWLANLVGRAGWQAFAARHDGRIVGGGFVHVRPPLAWLGLGSILPECRGMQGQRALFGARITHAQEAGCTSIHTETGEPVGEEPNPSLANMVRCGFERVASRPNYANPAPG